MRLGNKEITAELEVIYKELYPRKVGKTPGLKRLSKDIKDLETVQKFREAVLRYCNFCEKRERQYIKHFSTFAGEWRDWLECEEGDSVDQMLNKVFSEVKHD